MAGLATLALGGGGVGLADKVSGFGVYLYIFAMGALVVSLIAATITMLALGSVITVGTKTSLEDFASSTGHATVFLQWQLWSFLFGIVGFAMALGQFVLTRAPTPLS